MADAPGALMGHEMSDEAIDHFLTEEGVGVLSLAAGDEPYGFPISFGYDGDYCYFLFVGHSEDGRKVRLAEQAETASFLVYDVAGDEMWRSAIVRGPFARITHKEWDDARAAMVDNAYRPDLLTDFDERSDPRVWALAVDERTGRSIGY